MEAEEGREKMRSLSFETHWFSFVSTVVLDMLCSVLRKKNGMKIGNKYIKKPPTLDYINMSMCLKTVCESDNQVF